MANKLCIMVCENHKKEAISAIKTEGFEDVTVLAFPSRCGHPQMGWDVLGELIQTCENNCNQIELLGGCCLTQLGIPPKGLDHFSLHKVDQCQYLFINGKVLDSYLQEKAYLMTPGWLAHWQRHVNEWGFNRESVQDFFGESISRLVLLDTGIDTKSPDVLQEFADFVGLPFGIITVGLDFFRLFLTRIILTWRLEEERRLAQAVSSKTNRKLADYAMSSDLIADLAEIMTEKEAIQKILDLFKTLCAPARLTYLSLIEGKPEHVESRPAFSVDPEAMIRHLNRSHENYTWTEQGDGFILKITYQDETIGILEIAELMFPKYKEHYLNLSITVGRVCGLAIANARAYDKIKQAEEERERLINELQKALDNIKKLKGLLPICSSCKKIRDDKGYWNQLEMYIERHSDASFTHGLCPECKEKLYGHENWYKETR